ncbi:hypothetical protein GCM10020000_26570 [Streptomyces olivoverticillatus]
MQSKPSFFFEELRHVRHTPGAAQATAGPDRRPPRVGRRGAPAPPPAHADTATTGLNTVAAALRKGPVYVDPRASAQLPDSDAKALANKIKDADRPVFVAVLPASPEYPKDTVFQDLRSLVGVAGVYAVHLGDGFNAKADARVMSHNAVNNLVGAVHRSGGDAKTQLNAFVDEALRTAKGHAPDSWGGGHGGIGAAGLITGGAIVVAGGAGAYALFRRNKRKREERERAELDALRVVVDEDITAFGEELDRLDFKPSEAGATDEMRRDYERALDTYEEAKSKMAAAGKPQDVKGVTESLDEGRFALATLAARRTGAPLPERRLPCFFDPRHGPSTQDVQWAPPGGAMRTVPACAADAARVAEGEEPLARQVQTAAGPQPYWNAGPAYGPWAGWLLRRRAAARPARGHRTGRPAQRPLLRGTVLLRQRPGRRRLHGLGLQPGRFRRRRRRLGRRRRRWWRRLRGAAAGEAGPPPGSGGRLAVGAGARDRQPGPVQGQDQGQQPVVHGRQTGHRQGRAHRGQRQQQAHHRQAGHGRAAPAPPPGPRPHA